MTCNYITIINHCLTIFFDNYVLDNDQSLQEQTRRAALQELIMANSPEHGLGIIKLGLKHTDRMTLDE